MNRYKAIMDFRLDKPHDPEAIKQAVMKFADELIHDPHGEEFAMLPGADIRVNFLRNPVRSLTGFTVFQDHTGYLRLKIVPQFLPGTDHLVQEAEVYQLTAQILFDNYGMRDALGRSFRGAVYVSADRTHILMEPMDKLDARVGSELIDFVQESMELDVEVQPQPLDRLLDYIANPAGRVLISDSDMLRMGYELAGTIKLNLAALEPGIKVNVREWGDLGAYLDQNTLGGTEKVWAEVNNISEQNWRNVNRGAISEDEALVQTRCDVVNIAQQEVDNWIRTGGLSL